MQGKKNFAQEKKIFFSWGKKNFSRKTEVKSGILVENWVGGFLTPSLDLGGGIHDPLPLPGGGDT